MTDWRRLLTDLSSGLDLAASDASWAMAQVMSGQAAPSQIAAFVMGLRVKGESVAELTGMVEAILAEAIRVPLLAPAVDVVGTGGDGAPSRARRGGAEPAAVAVGLLELS